MVPDREEIQTIVSLNTFKHQEANGSVIVIVIVIPYQY